MIRESLGPILWDTLSPEERRVLEEQEETDIRQYRHELWNYKADLMMEEEDPQSNSAHRRIVSDDFPNSQDTKTNNYEHHNEGLEAYPFQEAGQGGAVVREIPYQGHLRHEWIPPQSRGYMSPYASGGAPLAVVPINPQMRWVGPVVPSSTANVPSSFVEPKYNRNSTDMVPIPYGMEIDLSRGPNNDSQGHQELKNYRVEYNCIPMTMEQFQDYIQQGRNPGKTQ